MQMQCKRIYSAMPSLCDRICNGRCERACASDASPESRVQSPESTPRVRAVHEADQKPINSPSPYLPPVQRVVWQILIGGLHALSDNDFGRPWPYPVRQRIAKLTTEHDDDLCLKAAREARAIVMSQDRAPNITGLFEKKLRDLAEVRATVRESLGAAA
jgi:hypothetical protein